MRIITGILFTVASIVGAKCTAPADTTPPTEPTVTTVVPTTLPITCGN